MSKEEVGADRSVSDGDEGAHEEVEDEVHELVGSAYSVVLGVDPGHCELVEDHFDVHEGAHYDFADDVKDCHTEQDWDVEDEKQSLVNLLRV